MTDRELLEFAAKAAGLTGSWELDKAFLQERWYFNVPYDNHNMLSGFEWNPLKDDGDALRLHVFCYQTYGTEYIERFNAFFDEQLYMNPSYATAGFRRAVTANAAEIGKAMQ